MGQSPSSPKPTLKPPIPPPLPPLNPDPDPSPNPDPQPDYDCTYSLPDETLSTIFHTLSSSDRKRASLVCKRWLQIEGQSRTRLSLNAHSDLHALIPRLFTRFDSVTKLALKCDRRSVSISDQDLILISGFCPNLTRLKLRACREITDAGITVFAKNCKGLKKFSTGSCSFGCLGMSSLLENCGLLEELSVKRLRGITDGGIVEKVGVGKCVESLKVVCLKDLYNGQVFGPMIVGAKKLRSLKLFRCSGDWDSVLESVSESGSGIVEVHLERVQVSDMGLSAVSGFLSLEILHLVKTPECTNFGLGRVAETCRLLRKLHIDGWKTNRIGDEGLVAVASYCGKLQELVLIGVNPTRVSLEKLASNCGSLERLALCGSETVGDAEVGCIAVKCLALKKLCIKSCPVTDLAMEALACGCPNLVKVKVKKCKGVTLEGADWLRASRDSITVNLDAVEPELPDPSSVEQDIADGDVVAPEGQDRGGLNASRSNGRSISFKMRLGSLSGRSLVPSSFRRWSSFGGSSRNNQGN